MKRRVFLRASLLLVLILLISGGKEIFALDQLNTYLPVVVDQSSLSPPIISPSPSNTTTPKPPITTAIEIRVIDSSADAEENESGNMDFTSKDLELVYSGSNQTIGMNFNRIEIPQSATITNAYIQFKVDEASSEITALEIRAEATGDAELFSTLNRDISSRSMTTASVEWYPEPWQEIGEVGPNQRTPNISALIQEVINRSDWDEGNSIVLIVMGSGKRVAESYNGDPFGSPLLHIEYSSEPTPIPTHTTTITQTMTGSPTATATLTNTPTRTPIPQKSPTPSTTLTPTSSNTPTIINSPTAEPATSTFTPSNTPLVTNSPTPTPSPSEIPTSTITPSNTPIVTSSPTPSYPLHEFIEFSFVGPDSRGMGSPNPFLVEIETTFSGPGGKTYTVSGYYDGDGNGGMDGNLWKVKFNPEAPGVWTFGTNSQEPLLDGRTGIFSVFENSDCPAYQIGGMLDFSCVGRLEHIGDHYLKLHNGPYWLKGGEDDPEDFLAPGINAGFSSKYLAIDYLASKGVNSLYLLLNNIGGDGNNVWPWVGTTSSEAQSNQERFDLGKLAEWENLFSYIQNKGIVLHLLFEDDSGWTGFNRMLYYRQMISRFGHHNGIIWNISEEYNENYSANQIKAFAQAVRDYDPYDHPITVHHAGSLDSWLPFLGDNRFDLTSFQTEKNPVNTEAAIWFEEAENSGKTIPISFDETGKIGVADQTLARHIIWSAYMGGANFELHTFPLGSYADYSIQISDMTRARLFMEEIPFWNMRPMNDLLNSGVGYVFARVGEVYSIYLPYGGQFELDLIGLTQSFACEWFNPRSGSSQSCGIIHGGSILEFDAPSNQDWILLVSNPEIR